MGTEVDSLEVKISASAEQANQSLDKLIRKLDTVTSSIMSASKNAQGMGASFKFPNLNNIAKGIDAFSKIDTSSITKVGDRMRELASEFQTLNNVNFGEGAKQFVTLANSVSRLGNKSTTKALDVMPKIAPAINSMMAGLKGAPVVSQNLIEMTNAVAKLARTGSSGGKTVNSLVGAFNRLPSASNIASKSLQKVQNSFRSLTRQILPFINLFALIQLGKKSVEIASDLAEIQNVVDVTFGKYSDMVEKMASTSITDFGMSEKTVKDVASRFQAMGTAMGFAQGNMADMSIELTKLTGDMASFYNVSQKDVAKDLESIFTGESRPMRQYGVDLTEATLKEWAMKQGLDANVSSMTQAEKAMLRYQYVLANTTNAQGDFARTSDSFSNQVRILKQNFEQLGAIIGGTLINALKPLIKFINTAMSGVIAFAETISNALGKIFGWQFEVGGGGVTSDLESGADYADNLSDSIGSAADNAKKLKSYLLGIDELNVLEPQQDTSSSGSGTGAGASGGASGGEWTKGESVLKAFESEINSLFELGRYISDTLSEMMDSINWDSVYEKARGFGTGLAQFFNGLITPELFGNLGETIANAINAAFEGINAFAIEFDWENLGISLATGIDSFFENWDAGLSAEALSNLASGMLDSITGFISTLGEEDTFKDIGQKLVEFICGIEWKDLIYSLSNFFTALTEALVDFPTDFGLGVAEAIWEEISGQEVTLKKPDWLNNIADLFLAWIIPPLGAANIGQKIADALFNNGEHESASGESHGGGGSARSEKTASWMESAKTSFNQFFADIGTAATTFFDELYVKKLKEFIKNTSDKFKEWRQTISDKFEEIKTNISQKWENIKTNTTEFLTNIGASIREKWESIRDTISEKIENIRLKISQKWDEIKRFTNDFLTNIKNNIQTTWENIKTTISNLVKNIYDNVSEKFQAVKDAIKNAMDKASEAIDTFKTAISNAIDKIKDFFDWSDKDFEISLPTDIFDGFIEKVSDAIKKLKDFFDFDGKSVNVSGNVKSGGSVKGYATGGFPQRYSLFMAGENGIPEIAGTVGGRTAVAGGAEITGIRDAVYSTGQAELQLLQEQNALLRALLEKDSNIVFDTREGLSALRQQEQRQGYNMSSRVLFG